MKKKVFIILCCVCLLFTFILNPFISYSISIDDDYGREYISDMLEDGLNNGEISQDCYDDLKKQIDDNLTKAEMTDKLKENLFFFAVGQYANIAEDVVADALVQLADIWDYVFWDSNNQCFGFDDGIGEFIKSGLSDVIYTEPSDTIGLWHPIPYGPCYVTSVPAWSTIANYFSVVNENVQPYISFYPNGYAIAYQGAFVSGNIARLDGVGGYSYKDCNVFYSGSVSSGYYRGISGWNFGNETQYGSLEAALVDFFGTEITDEPVLHDAIIVNENPVFPSLSPIGALQPNYKTIVTNNYNNTSSSPPNSGLDINYYDYDYNYEVPFWESQELETIEYPEEMEFPSVEFETVSVDNTMDTALEGLTGWIIEFLSIAILLLVLGLII